MLHKEEDTLDLLGNYTKKKDPIKTKPLEKEPYKPKHNYLSGKINSQENERILYTPPLILACAAILIIFLYFANSNKNPILGKWRSVTPTIMGNIELEFTEKRMYALGVAGEVKYEEDGDKVIIYDGNKIFKDLGMVFTIKDKYTMENSSFGIKTIYKKIE